jgi:tRNA (cytidine32/uridine32-2'-O)-methyltransferase
MQNDPLLDNISIVLVDTRTPANIGAVARCMMNMGLGRLVLVDPPKDVNNDAARLAAGAEEILRQAAIVPTLAEALAGQNLVIGTSRHPGRLRKNIHTPREMAEQVVPLLVGNKVAVVFGSEVTGLENHHLALCQEILSIPSSPAFPSLNLSHAVMVVAYELFIASRTNVPAQPRELASAGELENFYRHLQETLQAIGFLDTDHPERMMFTFRQLFGRARLESRDISVLRGVLSSIDRMLQKGT